MPEGDKITIEFNGVVYVVSTYYAELDEQETVRDKILRLAQGSEIS
jgi:hypothetical protein